MVSYEYGVGFEREPKDLDSFLSSQGYELDNIDEDDVKFYQFKDDSLVVDLYYIPIMDDEDDKENEHSWKNSGYNVISELIILTKEFNSIDEVLRISKETVKNYDAIFSDLSAREYFRSSEL